MELGITPIITSGMVFQLLAGTQLIDVNLDLKSDRELYQTAQKRMSLIMGKKPLLSLLSPCSRYVLRPGLRLCCLRNVWPAL